MNIQDIYNIIGFVGMVLVTIGLIYAAYSCKPPACDKKH